MITHISILARKWRPFFFNANYTVKRCNIPLNIVRVRYTRCVLKMLRFGIIISILGNNIPQFMILAAILFLCKLGGQDIRIIFGIHHFWTQHTQIDLKSYRYRFYLDLHLRCLYSWNSPNLYVMQFARNGIEILLHKCILIFLFKIVDPSQIYPISRATFSRAIWIWQP